MNPIEWTPANRSPGPNPASIAAGGAGYPAVHGTIVRAEGPFLGQVRSDPWKTLGLSGLALLLLPWLLGVLMVVATISFLLLLLFRRSPHRGSGLLTEILTFHVLGSAFQPRRTVPVYHYVLRTAHGQLAVRQEGELAAGRIFVGNQVSLHGPTRGGELILRDGTNLTLQTAIRACGAAWRRAFPWIAAACLFQYAYLLSLP